MEMDIERAEDEARRMSVDRYPLSHPFPDIIRPDLPGWRVRYYRHLFNVRGDTQLVRQVCKEYALGMAWSLAYHSQHRVRDDWYYPYAYAPTAMDLCNHLAVLAIDDNKGGITRGDPNTDGGSGNALWHAVRPKTTIAPAGIGSRSVHPPPGSMEPETRDSGRPGFSPEMQLLMVLPPGAVDAHVEDPRLRRIAHDPDLGCLHCYPKSFRLLTYLKHFLSDCCPLLPDIDEQALRLAMTAAGETPR